MTSRYFWLIAGRRMLMLFFFFSIAALPAVAAEENDEEKADETVVTGKEVAELKGFDELMRSAVQDNRVPGGSLAIMRDGKLVYARGFGYANREQREPVQPLSLFRIASITK